MLIIINLIFYFQKKSHIETLINNSRRTSSNSHNQNQAQSVTVLVGDDVTTSNKSNKSGSFKVGAKLEKDEKSVLEELSTTNAEFKKVNEYLINEIEQLKRENDYLKVELLKMHMNDSLSESSSLCSSSTHNDLSSSQSISNHNISAGSVSAVASSPAASTSISNSSSSIITNSSSSNPNSCSSNDLSSTGSLNKSHDLILAKQSSSSSSSAASNCASSSHLTKNNSTSSINHQTSGHANQNPNNKSQPANCRNTRNSLCNRIDLSRYINDDDDEDDHYETDNHDDANSDYGIYSDSYNHEDCCFTSNLSVNEFIID